MKVAIISANLGSYDPPNEWPELDVPAGVSLSIHRLTDKDLPPRPLAMTSRLMCGIPKWFGKDFAPDADVIIWIDASCAPTPIFVSWWLDALGRDDIAVFRHPDRRTVQEEIDFVRARMAKPGERYLTSRYKAEWLDGIEEYVLNKTQPRARLLASTSFAYRTRSNDLAVALNRVFLLKARYHLHDQMAFSCVVDMLDREDLGKSVDVQFIHENYLKCPALTYTRNKK